MAWATPKTDWDAKYVPSATDLNRIEENTRVLSVGELNGGNLASSNSLDIGLINTFFRVTGVVDIKYISTVGRIAGSRLYLQISTDGAVIFWHKAGSVPSNYAAICTSKGVDYSHYSDSIVQLIYTGTYWMEVGQYT